MPLDRFVQISLGWLKTVSKRERLKAVVKDLGGWRRHSKTEAGFWRRSTHGREDMR